MRGDNIVHAFADMIRQGSEIRRHSEAVAHVEANARRVQAMFADVSTDDLKRMWDECDGSEPMIDDLHLALGLRGEQAYVAV